MKLIFTKMNIKRKNKSYMVVIPERTGRIVNNREEIFDADRKGLNAILMSALIMIKDPNSIVYFPLKKPLAEIYYHPDYDYFYEEDIIALNDIEDEGCSNNVISNIEFTYRINKL